MQRSAGIPAFICTMSVAATADTKSDILDLTANARTRAVWVRFPWCDAGYNPVRAYKDDA